MVRNCQPTVDFHIQYMFAKINLIQNNHNPPEATVVACKEVGMSSAKVTNILVLASKVGLQMYNYKLQPHHPTCFSIILINLTMEAANKFATSPLHSLSLGVLCSRQFPKLRSVREGSARCRSFPSGQGQNLRFEEKRITHHCKVVQFGEYTL